MQLLQVGELLLRINNKIRIEHAACCILVGQAG
jgi:hypothetical protein